MADAGAIVGVERLCLQDAICPKKIPNRGYLHYR